MSGPWPLRVEPLGEVGRRQVADVSESLIAGRERELIMLSFYRAMLVDAE